MNTEIWKALQHAKYKAGIGCAKDPSSSITGEERTSQFDLTPYDTSIAWLELTQLCQCNGPLQQDVLLALCVSLNHSSLSPAHVPSLVYIAGLCFQWLKDDNISQEQQLLRTGELLLLKIVYLISLRLYYHHITGFLLDSITRDDIRQLKFDLEGFENREKVYRNLPEALLHWKTALEIGLIVCENYTKSAHDSGSQSRSSSAHLCRRKSDTSIATSENTNSPATSHGGNHISPILWHSLDIWQCTKQRSEVLYEAIQDLLACSTEFTTDQWIEGALAMNILCTASQLNVNALNLVQALAKGNCDQPEKKNLSLLATSEKLHEEPKHSSKQSSPPAMKGILSTAKKSNSPTSSPLKVATLNMLGMQPDFNDTENESLFTTDQPVSYAARRELNTSSLKVTETTSDDDIKTIRVPVPRALPKFLQSDYRSTMDSVSVATQSLIANESIPDALPSAEASNITINLDLGSITTLDPVESLGKSIGLLTSSNSKNLDFSVSNLVSPCLAPSGELTSKEDLITVQSSPVTSGKVIQQTNIMLQSSMSKKPATEKKAVEVNWEHTDQVCVFDEQNSAETDCNVPVEPQHSKESVTTSSEQDPRPDTQLTHFTHSTAPLTGGANMLGSQVHPSTVIRHSTFSSEASAKNQAQNVMAKFENWPSEIALTYALCMASIGIFGSTSLIQRIALEGSTKGKGKKYALLDLAEYEATEKNDAINVFDWSVRHGAVLGLSRVSKTCCVLPMKDGLSDLAWWKLVERHKVERDSRVLQAFSIAQVEPNMDETVMSAGGTAPLFSPLLAHIADGLCELFLPSLVSAHCTTKRTHLKTKSTKFVKTNCKKIQFETVQSKVKTQLDKPRLGAARPSLHVRTIDALNKIAEEDWKRQMEEENRTEEPDNQ